MLLGLVREGEGVGAQVLGSLGVDLPRVRRQVVQLLESYGVTARVKTPEAVSQTSRGNATSSVERVGREWSARVVRPGRTPPDYEAAYEELEDLFEDLGIATSELDLSGLVVMSVETSEGPGLSLSINHRVEDGPESDPKA